MSDCEEYTAHDETIFNSLTYEDKVKFVHVIANPIAPEKLAKKLLKVVDSSIKQKQVLLGVKSVPKAIKKKKSGIVLIAGDVSPIDIVTHIPVLCEKSNIPYVFLPSKRDLGLACGSKKSVALAMVQDHEAYSKMYKKLYKKVSKLPYPN